MGFLLFIIALVLIFLLTIVNYWYVEDKAGYFRSTAKNLDIFANREFRAFWNAVLIEPDGYKFGREGETLSSALGKNQMQYKLKRKGRFLVRVLDKLDKNHCINSIDDQLTTPLPMSKLNQPTPVFNTILWKLGSFVYALIILLNQNLGMLSGLGLSELTESWIKIFGAVAYFLFTYFNFNQSTYSPKKP
jgi:hypothetical protein